METTCFGKNTLLLTEAHGSAGLLGRYDAQIAQLIEMGFADTTNNVAALEASRGDLQRAIERFVCAADGQTYERSFIEAWLADHGVSPLTNETLPHKFLTPNLALKQLIDAATAATAAASSARASASPPSSAIRSQVKHMEGQPPTPPPGGGNLGHFVGASSCMH